MILGSGMAFRPELGPVSILWVADAYSFALGWTMAFSCNCSVASTHLHDLRLQGGKSKTQWLPLAVHLKYTQETQERWANKAPSMPPCWRTSLAVSILPGKELLNGLLMLEPHPREPEHRAWGQGKGRLGAVATFAREPPWLRADTDAPAVLIILGGPA